MTLIFSPRANPRKRSTNCVNTHFLHTNSPTPYLRPGARSRRAACAVQRSRVTHSHSQPNRSAINLSPGAGRQSECSDTSPTCHIGSTSSLYVFLLSPPGRGFCLLPLLATSRSRHASIRHLPLRQSGYYRIRLLQVITLAIHEAVRGYEREAQRSADVYSKQRTCFIASQLSRGRSCHFAGILVQVVVSRFGNTEPHVNFLLDALAVSSEVGVLSAQSPDASLLLVTGNKVKDL